MNLIVLVKFSVHYINANSLCELHLFILTGRGGASIYGKEFADEIHEDLKHGGKYHFKLLY